MHIRAIKLSDITNLTDKQKNINLLFKFIPVPNLGLGRTYNEV